MKFDSDTTDVLKTSQTNAGAAGILALAAAEATHQVTTIKVGERTFYSVPQGRELKSFEMDMPAPPRLKGAYQVNDAESFLKMLARFKTSPALVQFSRKDLYAHCIFNAAKDEAPAWGDHTMRWQLKKHRDLEAWIAKNNKDMTQLEFMLFLEDRIVDVDGGAGAPSQSVLQTVIGDLEVRTDAKFQAKREIHDGSYVLRAEMENTPAMEVPKEFVIALPIFDGMTLGFRITVRLRYRISEGKLTFTINLANFDAVMDEAWEQVVQSITKDLPKGVEFIHIP